MSEREERGLASAAGGPAPVAWGPLLEHAHAKPAIAVVLCTVSSAFGFFVTAAVLPSVVADIGSFRSSTGFPRPLPGTSTLGSRWPGRRPPC